MNQKEWKFCNESNKYEWYNKTRKIQKSLQFNEDKTATVIHHLRDTEEQRKYRRDHWRYYRVFAAGDRGKQECIEGQ